jgi:hypothetical protein
MSMFFNKKSLGFGSEWGGGLTEIENYGTYRGAANYDILEAAEDLQELKTMIL